MAHVASRLWRPHSVVFVVAGVVVLGAYGVFRSLGVSLPLLLGAAWLGVVGLALWAAGRPLYRHLIGPGAPPVTQLVLELCLGALVLMAVAGALGTFGLLLPPLLLAVLAIFASRGAVLLWRQRRPLEWPGSFLWWPLGAAAIVTALAALTLSPLYDVWHYQLAFPEQWLLAGTIHVAPRNIFSYMPANMGLLYLYGLAGPGYWAAQLLHWGMGLVATLSVAALARTITDRRAAGFVAATLFAATPTMIAVASEAMADLGVAAFAGAAWLSLLLSREESHWRWRRVLACGLLAGGAAGAKILALATLLLPLGAVGAVVWFFAAEPGRRWRHSMVSLALLGLGASFTMAPWALRNLWLTGNPVYPFLHQIVTALTTTPDALAPPKLTSVGTFELAHNPLWSALSLRSFTPLGTGGDIGPLFLWLLPLWLLSSWVWGRRSSSVILLAGFVLTVIPWAAGRPLGRYLLPGLVLAAAGSGAALGELSERWQRGARWAAWAVLSMVLVANINPARTGYAVDRIACTLGFELESTMLDRLVSCRPAFKAADELLADDAVVLFVGESRTLGFQRAVVAEDPFQTPLLVELAEAESDPDGIAEGLRARGITHILINHREAERVARMNGRNRYLQCSNRAADVRLATFIAEYTLSEWQQGGVEIRRLMP